MNELSNKLEAIREGISNAYDAVEAKGGTLPTTQDLAHLATAVQSVPSATYSYYDADMNPIEDGLIIPNRSLVKYVKDNTTTIINKNGAFQVITNVLKIEYSELITLQETNTAGSADNCWHFRYCTLLQDISFPKLLYIRGDRIFDAIEAYNVRRISMPLWYGMGTLGTYPYYNCPNNNGWMSYATGWKNLIDFESGKNWTRSISLAKWLATNALLEDSTSLVEEGETFASNREKLMYNIREHLAKNLNQSVTATITFSAALGEAISADADTLAAFPSSWTIAY